MSQLHKIVGNNDVLQPSKEQEETALEKSRAYWYHIASVACAYLDHGLVPEFANPQHALHKIPRFPCRLKAQLVRPLGTTAIFALCSEASSTGRLVGNSDCEAVKKERTKPALVQIGTGSTIPYSFCGKVFSHWIGMATEKGTGPNYLGILAIGWCYILSAQLIEMQGSSAVMRYTDSLADCVGGRPSSTSEEAYYIDVGEVDARIARWWSAILAKREGRASLSPAQTPLSSDEAFYALLEFARLHDLGSQVPIALTIAMSFPMHRYYGTQVKLPPPRAHGGKTPATTPSASPWSQLKQDLPYYMALSCSPEVMISTLCGSFWQPDIPCNMVSQWLHPVLEEVLRDVPESKYQEIVALIGAIRRPSVAALWIGAAVSGIGPKLLEKVRRGRPPLDSIAFPWTGAPQSFMDDAGSGPYTWGDPAYISKPDVWRLLHLSPTEEDELSYEYGPVTPWEPCGACLTTNCALRVISHLKCPRHEYRYEHWSWELEGGETVQDYGFLKTYPSLLTAEPSNIPDSKVASPSFDKKELDPNREASDEASLEVFRWFVFSGEGLPPEKIYHDDLFQEIWEQDDDSVKLGEADHRHSQEIVFKNKDRVETWRNTIG
ncbi:hypothetical protein BDV30DRAFT_239017 [Aspergillus minisclerotigenes]|uniref:Uncharacterized protein n=1 Tax=Aspergillus minisclerotigenes TaxID=656917 RepID=A0A5N6J2T7_9EURO|nr:hypothetical protein BDV30DRAFT_239017 [Aspergillus minisclerotigenes]